MGNFVSTTLYTRPEDFAASDKLLDQMEKQECMTAASNWMETAASFSAIVLSTMGTLLVGNLTGSLEQPMKRPPILIDAACQTEDGDVTELAVSRDWQPSKDVDDSDSHSCTTEATDLFTDAETEESFDENDSQWDNVSSASDDILNAICDACEGCSECDCEIQAEQLLRLTAIVCTEDDDDSRTYLEDYLCTCGECPQYQEIALDVATETSKTSLYKVQHQQSVTRLLQAFSTYNEVLGYRPDMIPAAHECLQIWSGDEDKAFKSFVTLYDDVPHLCDACHRA
ncbi:hypothetical protein PF010_g5658 [Phytophthora fragariae]|uniref:Rab-GAP TBC domain-containing protein n=1 Tax=Phytophthora fragariae TaxID=53985 RepID=A0A6A3LMH2_9STRA|nr:hypothetical protein PF011_g5425 [Phytophthora fragariae]KAE9125339.1 hypothetical protein PF010_g5658 [Phytophthora fragariae]KAE9245002.1 hypothetical protein PF004_g5440 [Phytophthora fragariae]KAE9351392.1 hypothetical protein PF008_g5965 [Phytophthora fragariae]